MTRIFGHTISPEMAMLWLTETLIGFSLLCLFHAFDPIAVAPLAGSAATAMAGARMLVLALILGLTGAALGLYRPAVCLETRRALAASAIAGAVAIPVLFAAGHLLARGDAAAASDIAWVGKVVLAWVVFLHASRAAVRQAVQSRWLARRVVVLDAGETVDRPMLRARSFGARGSMGVGRFEAIAALSETGRAPGAAALRQAGVWGVILTVDAQHAIDDADLRQYGRAGIRVFDEASFRERQQRRVDLARLTPDWLRGARTLSPGPFEAGLRRLGDIVVSLALLVFTLPLMLLVAVCIKLDSAGPVFYRQMRVGLGGRPFELIKFRSMRVDAEAASGPAWASKNDCRVTRVGRFIRLTRIDELPQLVNVLRGEMSMIGPRPERPHFVEHLSEVIPHFADRARVKPGLTGWAQVNYPYGASIEDARMKLSYDLYYVRHRTVAMDLLILAATVRVILFQEGAR